MRKIVALLISILLTIAGFAQSDSIEIKLQRYKDMFVKGLISANEYEILRKQTLAIEDKSTVKKLSIDTLNSNSFSAAQLILCKNANKENCDSVTRTTKFKMGGGSSAHVCVVVKGIIKTSVIRIRIRLHHHKDIEFVVSDYTPSDTMNCIYQDILIFNKGKHEIEILDDKGFRVLIGAFVVN